MDLWASATQSLTGMLFLPGCTSVPDDLGDIPKLAAAGVKRLAVPVSSGTGLRAVISGPEDALKWRDTIEKYADL